MTVVSVVVESTLTGVLAGFQSISVDDSQPVQEIVNKFCAAKGSQVESCYALLTSSNMVLVNRQPISDFFISDGEVLQLVALKRSSVLVFRQWLTMSGIGMIVGLAGLITVVLLYAVFRNVPDNYAMVIDAGSTHTDMILYSWPGSKRNNTGEVFQVHLCSATGGIAQITPDKVGNYFDPCFEEVYDAVKEESRNNVEVLFGATAGMRLLNQSDPTRATETISNVRSYLSKSKWKFKETNVGIISGATEGVSGWITTNFLQQTVLHKGSTNDTFGAMDLGGASTQISLEVSESEKNSPNVYPITLFGNKFYVFSQSYLCHGVVQALRRYRTLLRAEQGGTASNFFHSPCEPRGWNITLRASYFTHVCTTQSFLSSNAVENDNITAIGTGNHTECKIAVSKLLNFTECTKSGMEHCVDPSQLPSDVVQRSYYAFAAFGYITQDLGIPHAAPVERVQRYIKVVCDYDIVRLADFKSKSTNLKRKFEVLCFEGQYMFTLLSEVYGFTSDLAWSRITFTNQAKSTTLGWSLGYMVNATEEIAAGPSVPRLKVVPFSLLTVLFILFVLLSFGFIVHALKMRKNSASYHRKHLLMMDEELEKFIPMTSTTVNPD